MGKIALASVLLLLSPLAANSQQVLSKFDGTYMGVSWNITAGEGSRFCIQRDRPRPITITAGQVSAAWDNITVAGSVDATGKLFFRTSFGGRADGQVNPDGSIIANYMGGQTCGYRLVWRKA